MIEIVIGGSGSGKSEYAENTAVSLSGGKNLIYIATMIPYGDEAEKRIKRHRHMRMGKGFKTVEVYSGLDKLEIGENATVLIECMSNLLANEMFNVGGDYISRIKSGINRVIEKCDNVIMVTNEIFSDGTEYDKETTEYIKSLGEINIYLSSVADVVTEVVYSISIRLKGDKRI